MALLINLITFLSLNLSSMADIQEKEQYTNLLLEIESFNYCTEQIQYCADKYFILSLKINSAIKLKNEFGFSDPVGLEQLIKDIDNKYNELQRTLDEYEQDREDYEITRSKYCSYKEETCSFSDQIESIEIERFADYYPLMRDLGELTFMLDKNIEDLGFDTNLDFFKLVAIRNSFQYELNNHKKDEFGNIKSQLLNIPGLEEATIELDFTGAPFFPYPNMDSILKTFLRESVSRDTDKILSLVKSAVIKQTVKLERIYLSIDKDDKKFKLRGNNLFIYIL